MASFLCWAWYLAFSKKLFLKKISRRQKKAHYYMPINQWQKFIWREKGSNLHGILWLCLSDNTVVSWPCRWPPFSAGPGIWPLQGRPVFSLLLPSAPSIYVLLVFSVFDPGKKYNISTLITGDFLPFSSGRISAPFPIENSHLFSKYHVRFSQIKKSKQKRKKLYIDIF